MNGIVWIASYPKSGNTWFRAFLSNLIGAENEEVGINNMKTDGIFSSRVILDALTGIESSNLTLDEIDRLRPKAYNYLSRTSKKPLYIKAHDAYTYLDDGSPLLGTDNARAIYLLRNPLDVAVSYANHATKDLDKIIGEMSCSNSAFCKTNSRLLPQTRQKLLSWSEHVESWENARELPVHIIRYEDMIRDPLATFTGAARFMGFAHAREEILSAVEASSFDKLKANEERDGFREKPANVATFFRVGRYGDWRTHLNTRQRDKIIDKNREIMIKYGYLDVKGVPVFQGFSFLFFFRFSEI